MSSPRVLLLQSLVKSASSQKELSHLCHTSTRTHLETLHSKALSEHTVCLCVYVYIYIYTHIHIHICAFRKSVCMQDIDTDAEKKGELMPAYTHVKASSCKQPAHREKQHKKSVHQPEERGGLQF